MYAKIAEKSHRNRRLSKNLPRLVAEKVRSWYAFAIKKEGYGMFQDRLYQLRRARGISQEELAGLVGVSRQAVQKWEAGTSMPDVENLVALSDYFGVTLDYLIKGVETSAPVEEPKVVVVERKPWHYEFKSRRTLFGLPLVHVNMGHGWPRRAKGIIAVGNIATGVLALGGLSVGLLTLGGVGIGLIALGGLALGSFALGGVSIGLIALGGVTLGWLAIGGVSLGMYAIGGIVTASRVAVGDIAAAPLAVGHMADGVQAFTVGNGSVLTAARAQTAIGQACMEAPGWLVRLLQWAVHTIR